jgi:hypothetical protein
MISSSFEKPRKASDAYKTYMRPVVGLKESLSHKWKKNPISTDFKVRAMMRE